MTDAEAGDRLIPQPAVCDRTAMSRTTVWRKVRDGEFPQPVKLGRRVAWSERAVAAWIAERHAQAQAAAA